MRLQSALAWVGDYRTIPLSEEWLEISFGTVVQAASSWGTGKTSLHRMKDWGVFLVSEVKEMCSESGGSVKSPPKLGSFRGSLEG